MKFTEYGCPEHPAVVLLHGGGLSVWSLEGTIEGLLPEYRVVAPVIDGHGEDWETEFISIEDSAEKLIRYIDENHGGRVFAICGLSLGAQIAVEALSRRSNIAHFAVLESALVVPMKSAVALASPMYGLFYGLIKQKWFSRLQAKSMCLPERMFNRYYDDSIYMTKQSLINISRSNGNYALKPSIRDTKARVLVIAGGKELHAMIRSAEKLHVSIPGSRLYIAENMRHGELSLAHPDEYLKLIKAFFRQNGQQTSIT